MQRPDSMTGAMLKRAILAMAVAGIAIPSVAMAATSGTGTGTEYVISTTGATALGDLTRQASGKVQLTNLGNTIGDASTNSLTIGGTTYWNTNLLNAQPLTAIAGTRDGLHYYYHETGSIEGIIELANTNSLTGAYIAPNNPTATNKLWTGGGNSLSSGSYVAAATNIQLAWSDVNSVQGFSYGNASQSTVDADPGTSGYGFGNGTQGGTNFQQYRNISTITRTLNNGDGGQANFRNETVAVVPFTFSANPGTGLETLTADDAKWLNTTGRLANGANFNVSTRDAGSGTRNQGANNLGYDPTYASGERDRISSSADYNVVDLNNNTVTVHAGDEAAPLQNLTNGSTTLDRNEDRAGDGIHFADKTSGGSRLRPTILSSRMGMGILSATDVSSRGLSSAATASEQLRVLKIDFGNGSGYVQPTADNVTTNAYEMWSQAQMVTVVPVDYTGPTDDRINGDTSGQVRNFINNILNSANEYPNTAVTGTPADGILASNFLLPGFLKVSKEFDGGPVTTLTTRELEAAYQAWKTVGGASLNWADPSTLKGYVASGSNTVRYDIYRASNTAATGSGNADRSIVVTARTALVGDFSGDGVRDIGDTTALAQAIAAKSVYYAAHSDMNFTPTGNIKAGEAALSADDNLLVVGDFNADGYLDRNDAKFFLYGAAIDTTDASNANLTAGYGHSAATATAQERRSFGVRTGQLKKNAAINTYNGELLNLKTGGQISQGTYDALFINKFDVNGDNLVNREDAKLVDQFVGSSYTNLDDQLAAKALQTWNDASTGKVIGQTYAFELVNAELNDSLNGAITSVIGTDGTSDQKLIVDDLVSAGKLVRADANFDGTVNIGDFGILAANWQGTLGQKWSKGDFNFDGIVNIGDFGILAANWQGVAPLSEVVDAYYAQTGVSVPEPGSLTVLGLVGMAMLGRRRRIM